ncbi:MAG TPA: type II secretion system secretin GspD [Thermodesulfovibrionales bacterium]|nr:type II secretion system secretin GspD [Thermodesulfovibrionales bacterium]
MKKRRRLSFALTPFLFFSLFLHPLSGLCTPSFAEQKEEPSRDQKVTFNFVDVDLPVIAKFISEITKKNFLFDERVKGKITIIAPSKLSIGDAYNLFTSVLELKGFTVVPSGVNVYKIIPAGEAKQRGLRIESEKRAVNESYIARLIPLKYISADDALRFVQPIISKDGYASAFGPGNLLLVIDSGLNVEKVVSLIDSIDQPSVMERPDIVFLRYSSADAVAKMLTDGMAKRSKAAVPQPGAVEEAKAVADSRLNAVILFGDKGTRESMKALIALLDVPSADAQGRINVYFLENADATDLAKVLDSIIRGAQPQRQAAAPGAPPVTPFEAVGGITITADKASNSLIVVASPADYQNLLQVIRQLDKRRRQVYVEAMIIEATTDKLRDLGVKWRAAATKNGEPVAIGGFGSIDQAAIQGIIQGLQGATLGGLGNFLKVPVTTTDPTTGQPTTTTLSIPGFAVLFTLNEFKDIVNVLSTPQILTSDNKEAEILVGENVPFISQSQTTGALGVAATTTSGVAGTSGIVNSIVRQDVGIILRITPQITEGDHVKLDIYQEISAVKNQSDALTISLGPTITKRSTKTAVVVKDNETVVIGGLIQEQNENQLTKVPFLGDIPILGYLFQSTHTEKTKTNLIVFLNPHVVKEPGRLAEITDNKKKEFAVAAQIYAEGELLVKFREGVADQTARDIISIKHASVIKVMEGLRIYHILLPKGQTVEEGVQAFSAIPEVEYAEPNYIMKMQK